VTNCIGRRPFILGAGLSLTIPDMSLAAQPDNPFPALEAQIGGRIGVAALDTFSHTRLLHRADERFAMCSTFKWILASAILAKVDQGQIALNRSVSYGPGDLLGHAPVTTAHVGDGALPVEMLCAAAMEESDNTAANLLLALIEGPSGLTDFLRGIGDATTRLDRNEPGLNTNLPGDGRDTTTPNAMVATMQSVLLGKVLSPAARDKLLGWMKNCRTGLKSLRAGVPQGWVVGDKTGSGVNGAFNDVAIVEPPGRPPILIAAYLSDSQAAPEVLQAMQAQIAKTTVAAFS